MIIKLDFASDVPIYQQIRNGIVYAIAENELKPGEKLPTVRVLALESGINTMTVSKAYQLLKQEGYIITDRRNGAMVHPDLNLKKDNLENNKNIKEDLQLIIAEAKVNGVSQEEFLEMVKELYGR